MKIEGSRILITGAGSGIGAAVARRVASIASHLFLLDKDAEGLQRTSEALSGSGTKILIYPTDLTKPEKIHDIQKQVIAEAGGVDIIVNAAGSGRFLYLEETTDDDIVATMASPYFAAAYITKAFLSGMLERNHGVIVNITSVADRTVWPGATCYAAARWAMRGFAKALQADLAGTNVHAIWAEFTEISSGYWQHNLGSKERVPGISKLIPTLTPEKVANLIVKGIRKDTKHVTGHFVFFIYYYLCPMLTEWLVRKTGIKRKK